MARLAVTLVKSPIGNRPKARATVLAIGLRRINQTVVVADTPSSRGMLKAAAHLLRVETAVDSDGAQESGRISQRVITAETPAQPVAESERAPQIAEPAVQPEAEPVAKSAQHIAEVPAVPEAEPPRRRKSQPSPQEATSAPAMVDAEPKATISQGEAREPVPTVAGAGPATVSRRTQRTAASVTDGKAPRRTTRKLKKAENENTNDADARKTV